MVLGAVGEAVEEQVDAEKEKTPRYVGLVRLGRPLVLLARVQSEDGHTGRDGRDNEILVQRVALAENGDVQEHDGQQFAALGEQEGDVVDVRETGIAKGTGQAAGDGNEGQRAKDAARGNDGWHTRALRSRNEEVQRADNGCEQRLNRVEEDGEMPTLRRILGAVRRRSQFFLQIGPGQAVQPRDFCVRERPMSRRHGGKESVRNWSDATYKEA